MLRGLNVHEYYWGNNGERKCGVIQEKLGKLSDRMADPG